MDFTVFIIILFALQLVCLVVGSRASKSISSQEDYFLAGRGLSFFPLLMTFVATQIGGGTILGSAEEAYHYGWNVILYPLGCSLGFLLLAAGLGRRMYRFKVSTVAQIYEVAYQSTNLKKVASALSIVSLFMIFVGQVIASKKFMVSVGFDDDYIYAAFWTIVVIYTVVGGLQAVVATDVIQALFFIVVFVVSFFYILFNNTLPVQNVIESGFNGEHFTLSTEKFSGWLLMPLLFMVIEQDMGQRCFAAKSGRVVAWASGIAAVVCLSLCIIPIYMGILGKTLGIEVDPGSSVLMTVVKEVTTPTFAAFLGCAVLAAIVSTADSLINAISSNLMQDFNINKKVGLSKMITGLIAVAGISASYFFTNVVDTLILSYELSISCLFVSVFAAMFTERGEKLSAILSILLGALGFIIFRNISIGIPKEVATLLLSAFGYFLGLLLAKVPKPEAI